MFFKFLLLKIKFWTLILKSVLFTEDGIKIVCTSAESYKTSNEAREIGIQATVR